MALKLDSQLPMTGETFEILIFDYEVCLVDMTASLKKFANTIVLNSVKLCTCIIVIVHFVRELHNEFKMIIEVQTLRYWV